MLYCFVQVAVAIKTLYGKHEVQNFIKEANSMASLNHKHIIQLYGIVFSQSFMLVGRGWGGGVVNHKHIISDSSLTEVKHI